MSPPPPSSTVADTLSSSSKEQHSAREESALTPKGDDGSSVIGDNDSAEEKLSSVAAVGNGSSGTASEDLRGTNGGALPGGGAVFEGFLEVGGAVLGGERVARTGAAEVVLSGWLFVVSGSFPSS